MHVSHDHAATKPNMVLVIEASVKTGVDPRTIHSWWKRGYIPFDRKRDKVYVDLDAVRDYERKRREPIASALGPNDPPAITSAPSEGFTASELGVVTADAVKDVWDQAREDEIARRKELKRERDALMDQSVAKLNAKLDEPDVITEINVVINASSDTPRERLERALSSVKHRRDVNVTRFEELTKQLEDVQSEDTVLMEKEARLIMAFADLEAAERLATLLQEI